MKNAKVLIRPFEKKDLEAVLRLDKLAFAQPRSRAWFEKQAKINPESFLVAEVNKKIIGYGLSRSVGQKAKISRFAVASQHQREGIDQQLIAQSLTYFRKKGIKKIQTEVRVNNQGSIKLFKSFHFQTKKTLPQYYQDQTDAYLMELLF